MERVLFEEDQGVNDQLHVIGLMLWLVVMGLAGMVGWQARQLLRELKKTRQLNRSRRLWPLRAGRPR
jgi:hypothetical protein